MDAKTDEKAGKCPVMHTTFVGRTNRDWWPNQLNIQVLHHNSTLSNPMDKAFDYAKEFKSLDLNAGRPTLAITGASSSAWHGTARARTASPTAAAAREPASSASRRSTACRITRTSTRRAGCCGRSSRNTGGKSPGPIL